MLWGILAVALVARFRYLPHIEHNVDHAYTVWQAMTTLDRGEFPLVGQGTSVLFANPPLTGYLFIPAVALTRSPLGVYVFVIGLNWFAVWLCYRTARCLVGEQSALVAAALMAVNPWMIEYSRTSWVQSLLPFFVCAAAWMLFPVLMGQSRRPVRRTALALALLALTMQTYLLAYFMLLPVGVLLWIFRRRVPWRGVQIGGAVIVLTTALYGIGLTRQWDDVRQRLDTFTTGDARLNTEAFDAAVRLVTGAEYELARGLDAPTQDSAQRHTWSQVAHYVLFVCMGIGAATTMIITPPPFLRFYLRISQERRYETQRVLKSPLPKRSDTMERGFRGEVKLSPMEGYWNKQGDAALILLIWFVLPILAMSYTSKPVHTFYQLLGVPSGYILAGWGIGGVFRVDTWRWGGAFTAVLWIPFAALMLTNSARYYQETAAIPGAHGLYALPVDVGLKMGDAINRALPDNGTVYALAEEWIVNSFAGRLFPSVPDVRPAGFHFVPREGGVYVQITDADAPLPAFATRTEIIPLPDGRAIYVDALPPAAQIDIPGTRLDVPSQQGITLVGYVLMPDCNSSLTLSRQRGRYQPSADGGGYKSECSRWTLTTFWRVDFIAPEVYERIYAPFMHGFDADGEPVWNVNGEGLAGYLWHEGDLHVFRITFALPSDHPAPFSLMVGLYDGLHNANVIFTPADGQPDVVVRLPETITN